MWFCIGASSGTITSNIGSEWISLNLRIGTEKVTGYPHCRTHHWGKLCKRLPHSALQQFKGNLFHFVANLNWNFTRPCYYQKKNCYNQKHFTILNRYLTRLKNQSQIEYSEPVQQQPHFTDYSQSFSRMLILVFAYCVLIHTVYFGHPVSWI